MTMFPLAVEPPPDVTFTADPSYITASIVVGVIVVIAGAVPKIFGPIGQTIESVMDSARRTTSATRAADVASLTAQIDTMQSVLADTRAELKEFRSETRRYQRRHDEVLTTHAEYDRAMIQLVVQLGGTPLPLPPLWPEAPPADPPGDGGTTDLTT